MIANDRSSEIYVPRGSSDIPRVMFRHLAQKISYQSNVGFGVREIPGKYHGMFVYHFGRPTTYQGSIH